MRISGLHNTTKQLAILILGFVVVICLLESAGLRTWAERLEVGRSRQIALQVTSYIDDTLKPLGLSNIRSLAIAALANHGWNESKDEQEGIAIENQNQQPIVSSATLPASSPLVVKQSVRKLELSSSQAISIFKLNKINQLPLLHEGNHLIPLPMASLDKPRVVALAGDSMMAVGLSVQLQRDLAKYKSIKLVRAFRSGTGLARPEVFNWGTQYNKMLGAQKPDVIICAIGANDGQGFVEKGKVISFGTPEWVAVYSSRVENYLNMLTKNGALVLWVKLPPMKSDKFERKISIINSIFKTVVEKNSKAIWWSPEQYLADANGKFRELAPVGTSKRIARIRSADGIHMLEAGASLFTPQLVAWLNPQKP